MKTFNYSSITLNKLEEIFTIEKNYKKEEFSHWFEKTYKFSKDQYRYLISKKYDAVEFEDLQKIYQNLQHVKQELM